MANPDFSGQYCAGIDGGSSSTRLAAVDAVSGELLASLGPLPFGTNIHSYPPEFIAATLAEALVALVGDFAETHNGATTLAAFCIGTAGLDREQDAADFRAKVIGHPALRALLPVDDALIRVASDVTIISACDASHEFKACVIAGTGSNCWSARFVANEAGEYLEPAAGTSRFAGGIDLPLSDWGGAARLGLDLIELAVRAACGMDPSVAPALVQAVYAHFGVATRDAVGHERTEPWRDLKAVASNLPANKALIARLVADVMAPIAEAGDRHCLAAFEHAARDLASMVSATLRSAGLEPGDSTPVAVLGTGSVLTRNAFVRVPFERAVRDAYPGAAISYVQPEMGAAVLARSMLG